MRKGRSFPDLPLFFLILGLLLLGAFGYFVFISLGDIREAGDFGQYINHLDELLMANQAQEALDLLLQQEKLPSLGRDRLSYLKRLRSATLLLGLPGDYAQGALEASQGLPRHKELAAVAVLALIEAGRHEEAADYAERRLSADDYPEILQEALLLTGRRPGAQAQQDLVLAGLPFSNRAEDFLRGAEVSGSTKLFLDGALLLLKAGQVKEAARLFTQPPLKGVYPLAAVRALYDAGNYDQALTELSFLAPEHRLAPPVLGLEGDLLLRLGQEERAGEFYRYLMDVAPDLSPAPYINSFYIRRQLLGEEDILLLRQSLKLFPRDLPSLLALGKALVTEGLRQETRELLRGGGIYHRGSPELDLLLLLVERSPGGGLVSGLWELRAEYPDSSDISAILMGLLFSLADHRGLWQLLESEPPSYLSQTYRALSLFQGGDIPGATEVFEAIAAQYNRRPEAFYNQAMVLIAGGHHRAALGSFQNALDAPGADWNLELLFRCRLGRAEAYRALGLFAESQGELREILAIDEDNIEAREKLGKLEGLDQS